MKASLKARLNGPNWTDELPWVLLGLRTVVKEDLHTSSAELIYGELLTVPGSFVTSNVIPWSPTTVFNPQVRQPIPTTSHGHSSWSIPKDLKTAQYVFVRSDSHRSPLQRPYDGPYHVVSHGDKSFVVKIGDKNEMISIDRLKPAYCDLDYPVQVAIPPRRGRPPKIVHYDPQNQPNDTGSVNEHTSRSGRPLRQTHRYSA